MFIRYADKDDSDAIIKLLSEARLKYAKQGFRAFVYFLDKDEDELRAMNKALKADNIALALLTDEERDKTLGKYKVHGKARSTILVHKDRVVTERIVDFDVNSDDPETLIRAIKAICQ